ncbi:dnaJ homolog subfamily C member 24-like [Hylaeus volcanicus]|uniref:dnaJ homolog subfamily C member 24-like n=1 Tax=Hylaeus volcanicus TaxID=313075 RepID=UPI0023B80885|nr:dnaJ homolog subfamily C member 24-like [Hylaeus volcanicus]
MVMTYETALSLLNITEIKDLHALQKCFRRKALHCHPDKIAHQLEKEAKTSTKPTEEFQHVLEAFEFLEKKLLNNNSDLKSLEFSTEDTLQAYQINLSETENVGLDTFFFSCRCGYDVTIDLDFATQHHSFTIVFCEGCSCKYNVSLKT